MSRLDAILRTMVGAIAEHDAVARRAADRAGWLAERGLDVADARSFSEVDDQAFFVYRRLIRGTIRTAVGTELPRTRDLLPHRFDADVEAFVSAELVRSHYIRDAAFEFLEFVAPRWRGAADVPAFAEDLARFELVSFESAAAHPPAGTPPRGAVEAKLDLEAPVVFDETVRVVRFGHPVHELAEGARELAARPTWLLIYRDDEFELRTLELTELAARIVEELIKGATLKTAIVGACTAMGAQLTAPLLEDVARVLADYAERGILLGVHSHSQTLGPGTKNE